MKHASLFTGIGGFDLAARWMGWENVFQVEIDPFCQKILKHHFPHAQRFTDIREFDGSPFRHTIDILSGGFPCQPYSSAGKRKGKQDDRHLWPEMLRVIREVSPRWVVGENVRGLISWNGGLVFDEVQADLDAEGYEVLPFLLPAAGVGAPHRRDRIWFIAHAPGVRRKRDIPSGEGIQRAEQARGEIRAGSGEKRAAADTNDWCRQEHRLPTGREMFENGVNGMGATSDTPSITKRESADEVNAVANEGGTRVELGSSGSNHPITNTASSGRGQTYRPREPGQPHKALPGTWENFPTQPPVCRRNDGVSHRVDKLKGLGNAVVPQVVLQIFKGIEQYELLRIPT